MTLPGTALASPRTRADAQHMSTLDLRPPASRDALQELGLNQEMVERLCIRNLLSSTAERIFFKDLQSRFLMVSAGFAQAYAQGRTVEEMIGKTDFDLFSSAHAGEAFADEQRIIMTGEPLIAKVERETFGGRADAWVSTTKLPLRDDDGQIIGTYGIARDVTEQVYAQETLTHEARHDPVTGLANRVALMDRLGEELGALSQHPGRVGVLFVDLNNFKEINDARGHELGDRLLAAVGRRMALTVRRSDTVGRLGGDEFVVLSPRLASDDDLRALSARLCEALRARLLGDDEVPITASIGIASTDDSRTQPDTLIAQADAAMYAAKRSGDGVQSYDERLHDTRRVRPALLDDLRDAVTRGELFIVYQPVIRLADGAMTGVEALVRWRHPRLGVVAPDQFIPIAERHGLIAEIDAYVMNVACRQLAAWERADPSWRERTIAVNLSGHGLHDPRRAELVLDILHRHGLAASRLCVEIGELDCARRVIATLADRGVRIALDDFGTGYSTLAHVQQLDADVIKIDRSFVTRIGREPRDRKIVAAVTAMAHALDMTVIAEGVENAVEREALAAVGCDEAQGYLFARPCEAAQLAELQFRPAA
jgi:diguanylate cyclase (GGDEF)-like protein/PAS domain S-box-containing protein